MLRMVGPLLVMIACKHSTVADAPVQVPTLDLVEFEPPFEEIPIAQAFIAKHGVKSIAIHDVAPGTASPLTVRSSVLTVYDETGAPVQTFERGSGHDFELDLITSTVYAHDAARMPVGAEDKVVVLDANGRPAKVRTLRGGEDTWTYDAAGHLVRVAHEADGKHLEELRTYDGDRLTKRTRGEVAAPPFETISVVYDRGRMSEWRSSKPGYPDDRYTFRYDEAGQLAELRFVENGKDVFQRSYRYDRDGFVTRVELHSSVPAMGSETYIYEYMPGHRIAFPVVFPKKPAEKTDADVLAAIGSVFHVIDGTGKVTWERSDPAKPYVVTVSFDIPAKEAELTKVELAAKACALRQALGYQCDCETLERAGAVTLTFHVNLGC